MPRPRHAMGRPRTTVFPADWAAMHAAVVEGTFDCTVAVGPAGTVSAFVPELRRTVTTAAPAVYEGPASITAMEGDSEATGLVAQDVVATRAYQVKIPYLEADVAIGHVVTVSAADDPMLVDKLKVVAIEKGSHRFSRILLAVDAT